MAAKDKTGFGLLSKVVGLVRKGASSWGESEPEAERESQYSKQMLKEMIERKRRNDFVRRREFDMLRKLRRSEVLAGQDLAARPSFFQSSLPSRPDDRATTLKKIDEIEAQMSMQWWKSKHGADSQRTPPPSGPMPMSAHLPLDSMSARSRPGGGYASSRPGGGYATSRPGGGYSHTSPQDEAVTPPDLLPMDFDLLGTPSSRGPLTSPPPAPPPARPAAGDTRQGAAASAPAAADSTPSMFSASKVFAIDVEEFAHDPELEEAAIRFANGDDEGAEAGLKEVLRPEGLRASHEETWLALFDLYRATGRQDRYEPAAIEFARRFGRSAPQWFSMPEQVHGMQQPAAGAGAARPVPAAHWSSPVQIGPQTVATLNAALARAEPPWRLSWAKLASIADAAVEPLTATFARWASQPVQLRFVGGDVLESVLKAATPSGNREVDPAWWKLRLEMLRVMHRPDEFELVALDYCVTYEVSPPSWEGTRCDFKGLGPDGTESGSQTFIGEAFRDSLTSTVYGETAVMPGQSQLSAVATVELAGQILGEGSDTLALLEERMGGADMMVIACDRLMRIDFTAAGTLLNWVMARTAEARQVQFVQVHRLVAAFFNVIGISEHARVIVRQD